MLPPEDLAAIYERISDDREGLELGVDRQREDDDALAETLHLGVYDHYRDNDIGASTRSKKKKKRLDYLRLLRDARAGRFKTIIAYTSGRLTRRPREHEDLIELAEEFGIQYQYVRSPSFDLNTAAGRRVARILAANDTGEAEDIAERVTRSALQRAQQGKSHGGRRPYGYGPVVDHDLDGNPIRDYDQIIPAEVEEIRSAYRDLLLGVPIATIVRNMNEGGTQTVTGRPWTPTALRQILQRPRNAGLSEYRGEIVGKGQWPAIVSEDIWHSAVALLADPDRRTSTGNRAGYLLSGLAQCSVCGGSITSGGFKQGGNGSAPRRVYRCRTGGHLTRRLDWVDQYVGALIAERLARPDAQELLLDSDRPDAEALREEATSLRSRLDTLAVEFADGTLTASQLRLATERMRRRLAEVETAQAHTSRAPILAPLIEASDVAAAWEALPLDRQRAVASVLIDVVMLPGGSGTRHFDPAYVQVTWKI